MSDSKTYVASIDLRGTPRGIVKMSAAEEASEVFDSAKQQAQVVGSALFSFARGVTAETREAISDSALLAQLVANKRASVATAPLAWYGEYLQVLQNVGWVMQQAGWADHTADGTAAEVHEKIIEVLKVALGPGAAVADIVASAIKELKAIQPESSWFTIFSRESQHASIARFQIGLAEPGENDDVFVSMLACLIEAQAAIAQVLLFKFRSEHATFRANSAKVSINRPALVDLGPAIRAKVRAYQADYLGSIKDI